MRALFFSFLFGVASVSWGQATFSSKLTELITVPASATSPYKWIDREIILKDNSILIKTYQKEGDTDIEIWDKIDPEVNISKNENKLIRTFYTFLIFDNVRLESLFRVIGDREGVVYLIERELLLADGSEDESLITRYHVN
ncbi:hypothetical protein [Christiangramia sp. OXR-203]|uniref:hypothetical protein n=1 Tax=Christiangramia sp. OXR-203 TaxID=3100176 RepID=UPI002AC906F0|nr:hypothetical protein [Christiangramia sp. OXR-203]WPY97068.1 hypothetical protein T8I65_07725 [Christiangramia sp. OXR-203]